MIMIKTFLLVALVFCVGLGSGQPSAAEFNLFCRILAEASDMMYGPGYVYDENADRETIKEMTVLYNATTANMKDFGNSLWDRKEFLKEHPPPMNPKNREAAHREIKNFIDKVEQKIEDNRKMAEEVNEKIKEAQLSVAQGIYGGNVTEVPKQDGNLTEILSNTESIFNNHNSATKSCGNSTGTGKTLLNDFFVCVWETVSQRVRGPVTVPSCHPRRAATIAAIRIAAALIPVAIIAATPNCCGCGWKQMKYQTAGRPALSLADSIKAIEEVCNEELMAEVKQTKDMNGLLAEYVGLIGEGAAKDQPNGKKIFGHSRRSKGNNNKVTKCDGSGDGSGDGNNGAQETANANICVDYSNHFKDDKYDIPWHNKFRNYTNLMEQAKNLEEKILKNRAALLLLKTEAWIAYSREKDDETSNIDDMNVSNLLDGTQLPPSLPLSYLAIFF
ncbi:Variant surface glycoprotein [Trypanosoma congolense IL3000]|uniref:Variant surface glycoprotein n=1 Tax=Trypanosoma congolense (strain IL3000) TaxID=1068625 RepID=F9W806_TRYCI|nr:Variant surface glycoprotein [Trypanosoma congolense IL3000]